MPSSFRDRFRRRSPAPPSSSSSSNSNEGIVSGRSYPGKSFLAGRTSSGSSSASSRRAGDHHPPQATHPRSQGGGGGGRNRHPPLATFDACIEACDALAATSQQRQGVTEVRDGAEDVHDASEDSDNQHGNENYYGNDGTASRSGSTNDAEVIPDCSVLVSPDGALLFTSQSTVLGAPNNNLTNVTNGNDYDNDSGKEREDQYPWTKISAEDRDGVILEEEYASAVVCGNDLSPSGDLDSNGFSARGWNHDAATVALATSREALRRMESFVEELAAGEKEVAARATGAAGRLGGFREEAEREGNRMTRSVGGGRMGPILSRGTNLSAAMEALEEYYAKTSEGALERWRMACSERQYPTQPESIEMHELTDGKAAQGKEQEPIKNPESIKGLLPKLRSASRKAAARTSEREAALFDIRSKFSEAQSALKKQKEWAASRWRKVAEEESNIDRLYAIKKMEQHEFYEEQRTRHQESAYHDQTGQFAGEAPLSEEVWEMVQGVANSIEDFGHTGYSPQNLHGRKPSMDDVVNQRIFDGIPPPGMNLHHYPQQQLAQQQLQRQQQLAPPKLITRADVERESEIADVRMVAHASDESVEDAAGKLLNIMSKGDTTLRSARLAAESCLLSECNAMKSTLRSLAALERASLEDRMQRLEVFEAAVDAIDVRKDIDNYIKNDKKLLGGCSRAGEDDDGGIAAALAVLNSHAGDNVRSGGGDKNIERPSFFEGWGEEGGYESDDYHDEVEPEIFADVIKMLFDHSPTTTTSSDSQAYESKKQEQIKVASNALAEKTKQGQSSRKSILYELNNQRSKKTRVGTEADFRSLCCVFDAFLSGCGRESVDVSNAKMLMILSQTFYFVDEDCQKEGGKVDAEKKEEGDAITSSSATSTTKDRERRIYVKSRICHHDIWSEEDFWDQAVYQCVSESLAKSGVLLNYVKSSTVVEHGNGSSGGSDPKTSGVKWHDLSPDEYAVAAAQVHAVVFAQLGTLSHSMIELGCGIPRACNFVRRLSIRYQLPLSLRITLIQHLMKNSNN